MNAVVHRPSKLTVCGGNNGTVRLGYDIHNAAFLGYAF
jgi:hypothetical protein